MNNIDFKEIESGEEFESFCEDLLRLRGYNLEKRASRGPDQGADIIASRQLTDDMGFNSEVRILVECKNNAKSGRSVKESDIGDVTGRTLSHNCNRYLLITSTTASTSVEHRIRGISANTSVPIEAAFWNANDLEKIITTYPELIAQYFEKPLKILTSGEDVESTVQIKAIHLHPDFSSELLHIITQWNKSQNIYEFVPFRPPREYESRLLFATDLHFDEAEDIALNCRADAGFEPEDTIIHFCEGRLYGGDYYQSFGDATWRDDHTIDTATISLNMMRKLVSKSGEETNGIFAMTLKTILYFLGQLFGLEAHKVTRTCIMDQHLEMPDILLVIEYGTQFCPTCRKEIKKYDGEYLNTIASITRKVINSEINLKKITNRINSRKERRKETKHHQYEVALSFAGEDRKFAESLAESLKEKGLDVFYDAFEKERLWGEDLYSYLDELYRFKALFCVMFVSENYANKLWTNHERKSAQAKAFSENRTYILPIRLDDTEVPGILPTVGYLRWDEEGVESIAHMIVNKIREEK